MSDLLNKDSPVPNATHLSDISEMDQLQSTMQGFGHVIAGYYNTLIKEGLSKDQAFHLVNEWHKLFWHKQYFEGPPIELLPSSE